MDKIKHRLSYYENQKNIINDMVPTKFQSLAYSLFKNSFDYYKCGKMLRHQQKGGDIKYKNELTFRNNTFVLRTRINKSTTTLSILSSEGDDCIIVFIDHSMNTAELHNLSYYKECSKEGLKEPGGGTILLSFILAFLRKFKKKYKINKIVLKDNSFKYCPECSHTIKLARLYFVLKGGTWYGKFGFLPFDQESKTKTKKLLKYYLDNKKLIELLPLKKLGIRTFSKDESKKLQLGKADLALFNYLVLKKVSLRKLFTELSKNYEINCCLIAFLLREKVFSKKSPLVDFFGASFYLDL